MIKNNQCNWHRLIYRIAPNLSELYSSSELFKKVQSGIYPEVLIVTNDNIRKTDPFLRAQGFYPYQGWKGMAREFTGELLTPSLPENMEIANLDLLQDREQWTNIVSTELTTPNIFSPIMIEKIMQQSGVKLFLLKQNGIGVSTLLIYESSNSIGLYLLATHKSARRNGFGFMMLEQTIGLITRQSKKTIILHATQIGENLHIRLGFKPYNQFFLYRYLNQQL